MNVSRDCPTRSVRMDNHYQWVILGYQIFKFVLYAPPMFFLRNVKKGKKCMTNVFNMTNHAEKDKKCIFNSETQKKKKMKKKETAFFGILLLLYRLCLFSNSKKYPCRKVVATFSHYFSKRTVDLVNKMITFYR